MPYSDYAIAHQIPELLTEAEQLIADSLAAGIPASHVLPLVEVADVAAIA